MQKQWNTLQTKFFMKHRRLVQTRVQLYPPELADQRQHLEGLTFERKKKKNKKIKRPRGAGGSEGLAIMRAVYSLSTSAGRSNGVRAKRRTDGRADANRTKRRDRKRDWSLVLQSGPV